VARISTSFGAYEAARIMAEIRPGEDSNGHCPHCKELTPVGWAHYFSQKEDDLCHVFLAETGLELFTLRKTRQGNWALTGDGKGFSETPSIMRKVRALSTLEFADLWELKDGVRLAPCWRR
jgi:hypothetical protein